MSIPQLEQLASELRDYIVEVTSQRGGHLGAPLGTIELTLALHKLYDTPRDKIVWDVGHQAYSHKILTGRREWFKTLRSYKGLCGFLKRSESEYDCFGAGHASTAISAAVGFAIARDQQGGDERVVAIVGDGAMTGGLAYEGLNNAGDLKTDLLVILNDNGMSISENVGAVSTYLNRLLTAPLYHRVKDDIEDLLGHLNERVLTEERFPVVRKLGRTVLEKAHKLKEGVKNMVLPSVFFEELGFTYYGPIPGHDLNALIPMIEQIKPLRCPIVLHVVTHKGKGYEWSENHPEKYHGAKPGFSPESGMVEPSSGKSAPSWTEIFANHLIAMSEKDPKIVAITAAMPSGTGLDKYKKHFPSRCYDVGIAEGHAVVSSCGMAAGGLKPVVTIYSTFLQRAFDMLIHDAAIQNLPVFFAMDRGGIVGDDGETHQGIFDMAYIRMIPNFVMMAPKDDCELREMMNIGIGHKSPTAMRYPRGNAIIAEKLSSPVEIGRAEILREGRDVCILAFGPLVFEALEIAEEVESATGSSIGVANMRFVKPMDADLVRRIGRDVGRIVTYEEGVLMGGAGSAVLEVLADAGITAQVRRIGVWDKFVDHGKAELIRRDIGLAPADLRRAVEELLREPAGDAVGA